MYKINDFSHLDPAEHAGIEDVHASIDLVGYKDLRFLHEAVYPAAVCVEHHHTVLRGLLHPRHLQTHKHQHCIVYLTLKHFS